MKEKLKKLFFDEELVIVCSNEKCDKDEEYLIVEEDISGIFKFFKYTNLIFLIHHICRIMIDLVFPTGPYNLGLLHYSLLGFIIFLFFSILINYFYIKEMLKNSKNNFNKKIKSKIKFILISILLITIFSVFNVGYGIVQIINSKTIYYFITLFTIAMLVIAFGFGVKILNYFFKQFDELNKETDGIV